MSAVQYLRRLAAASHVGPALAFAALAVGWSYPLVTHLASSLPGPGPGDNVAFLWNAWWARTALQHSGSYWNTWALFAPSGASLVLHSHTALPALASATVLGRLPLVVAHNVTLLVGLFLNGYCAYLLARRVSGDPVGALVGGIVYAGAPFVWLHLWGHANLVHAWTLPLFVLAFGRALDRRSYRSAVLAGLVCGLTIYVDYYYLLYEVILGFLLAVYRSTVWSLVSARNSRAAVSLVFKLVFALLVADVAVIIAILLTGGFRVDLGSFVLSARDVYNPLQAFWLLSAACVVLWLRLRIRVRVLPTVRSDRLLGVIGCTAATFAVAGAPVLWQGGLLTARGEYAAPPIMWRSGPRGIDLGTAILGNAAHGIWGPTVRAGLISRGIDVVESVAWFGVTPVVLSIVAVRSMRRRTQDETPLALRNTDANVLRLWLAVGAVFLVWSLGPHLTLFGVDTAMTLPNAVLRYVPIVANARMPGRAVVVCYLAVAVLSAAGVRGLRQTTRGYSAVAASIVALAVEFVAAPFPLTPLDHPAVYDVLAENRRPGAVLELPVGFRDGFGERGWMDPMGLYYQTIHQRPMIGGFLARLPVHITAGTREEPVLAGLLAASRPDPRTRFPSSRFSSEDAAGWLRQRHIAFVVFNRTIAPPELTSIVDGVLPLERVAVRDGRELYAVR